jgi:hypothetical protein
MLDAPTIEKARHGWEEATSVLKSMATFRQSARNTLQFLQAAYRQAVPGGEMQHGTGTTGVVVGGGDVVGGDAPQFPGHIVQGQDTFDRLDQDFLDTPLFSWEEYAANMGQGQGLDDLGFLTRLDFPDSLG